MLLSAKIVSVFDGLTKPERVRTLILDDSVITRSRSKKVELLAKVYDHVDHLYKKGFTLLTLGWSDGYSFLPVGFNMLSSAKKSNRYQEISANIDHRTNGYKNRRQALAKKSEAAVTLVKKALVQEPNNLAYIDTLAWGQYKLKNCKEANKQMKRVVDEIGLNDEEIKLHWEKIKECKK